MSTAPLTVLLTQEVSLNNTYIEKVILSRVLTGSPSMLNPQIAADLDYLVFS